MIVVTFLVVQKEMFVCVSEEKFSSLTTSVNTMFILRIKSNSICVIKSLAGEHSKLIPENLVRKWAKSQTQILSLESFRPALFLTFLNTRLRRSKKVNLKTSLGVKGLRELDTAWSGNYEANPISIECDFGILAVDEGKSLNFDKIDKPTIFFLFQRCKDHGRFVVSLDVAKKTNILEWKEFWSRKGWTRPHFNMIQYRG